MKTEHNSRAALYRTPGGAQPVGTEVTLRFAVAGAGIPRAVTLCTEQNSGRSRVPMAYTGCIGEYNIYTARITLPAEAQLVYYWFELDANGQCISYGNNPAGLGGVGEVWQGEPEKKFQITVYRADYRVPERYKNGICYQIFPDRFYMSGDQRGRRDGIIPRSWGDMPFYKAEQFGGEYLSNDFFGGNLAGIIEKLPYLASLGVTLLYLNPIFKAASNHRYDTGDYEQIDPILGENSDFERLCEAAREYGIGVILDGVFNHTGSDSRYFNKNGTYGDGGAYRTKSSPYYSWYRFSDWPEEYESWWGMKTLPQVEEADEGYKRYILTAPDAIVKRWLKAGAAGWRLDVADELPDDFLKLLRASVKEQNPDALIIGEVWEDASDKISYGVRREYLYGEELDSVMNYPLRGAVIDFLCGRIGAEEFDARISSIRENYPPQAYYALLNILSTHDTVRILTALSGVAEPATRDEKAAFRLSGEQYDRARRRLFAAYTLVLLMPGIPCIYYGDEAGMQGFSDPFCRGCYPWGEEDCETRDKVAALIALRKSSDAFSSGEIHTLYAYRGGYAMLRAGGNERFVVCVNASEESACLRIDAARFGITALADDGQRLQAEDGIFYVNLPPYGTGVFRA